MSDPKHVSEDLVDVIQGMGGFHMLTREQIEAVITKDWIRTKRAELDAHFAHHPLTKMALSQEISYRLTNRIRETLRAAYPDIVTE